MIIKHARVKQEMSKKLQSESLKERVHVVDLEVHGRMKSTCILEKYDVRVWTGCIRFSTGPSARFLWTR